MNWSLKEFIEKNNAMKVKEGFAYNSLDNTEWETVDSLRILIKKFVDPSF
jgi:hypothetical protein